MREIKFKAKRVSDGKWVEGSFIYPKEIVPNPSTCDDIDAGIPIIIDPNTICQFTGILDKNEKEIYEGDIVKYPNDYRECEVIYRANDYGAGFLTDSHDGIHSLGDIMNTLEVIGNIHDK